jgi:hypothetical protein
MSGETEVQGGEGTSPQAHRVSMAESGREGWAEEWKGSESHRRIAAQGMGWVGKLPYSLRILGKLLPALLASIPLEMLTSLPPGPAHQYECWRMKPHLVREHKGHRRKSQGSQKEASKGFPRWPLDKTTRSCRQLAPTYNILLGKWASHATSCPGAPPSHPHPSVKWEQPHRQCAGVGGGFMWHRHKGRPLTLPCRSVTVLVRSYAPNFLCLLGKAADMTT